jgi:uncharacterized protein (TIGR02145 family)/uncharacterized repeat protein (TIGR02543 family)
MQTTYSIIYNGNGKTEGDVPQIQDKVHGRSVRLAMQGNLTRAGFNFVGWNTASNGIGTDYGAGDSYSTDESLTLYAKWANWIVNGATCIDPDGNTYTTVVVGSQTWMKENLKTTHFNDGSAIPGLNFSNENWSALTTPAYCSFGNIPANKDTYGALYNWYAVNTGKLAPAGWHIPDITEWNTLKTFLGGTDDVAGKKMKESGTAHWLDPNTGTNESGFTAVPGGSRGNQFNNIGTISYWWNTELYGPSGHCVYVQQYSDSFHGVGSVNLFYGMPVRLIKD